MVSVCSAILLRNRVILFYALAWSTVTNSRGWDLYLTHSEGLRDRGSCSDLAALQAVQLLSSWSVVSTGHSVFIIIIVRFRAIGLHLI